MPPSGCFCVWWEGSSSPSCRRCRGRKGTSDGPDVKTLRRHDGFFNLHFAAHRSGEQTRAEERPFRGVRVSGAGTFAHAALVACRQRSRRARWQRSRRAAANPAKGFSDDFWVGAVLDCDAEGNRSIACVVSARCWFCGWTRTARQGAVTVAADCAGIGKTAGSSWKVSEARRSGKRSRRPVMMRPVNGFETTGAPTFDGFAGEQFELRCAAKSGYIFSMAWRISGGLALWRRADTQTPTTVDTAARHLARVHTANTHAG